MIDKCGTKTLRLPFVVKGQNRCFIPELKSGEMLVFVLGEELCSEIKKCSRIKDKVRVVPSSTLIIKHDCLVLNICPQF